MMIGFVKLKTTGADERVLYVEIDRIVAVADKATRALEPRCVVEAESGYLRDGQQVSTLVSWEVEGTADDVIVQIRGAAIEWQQEMAV